MKEKTLPQISNTTWLCDLAFLIDITGHLNDLNLKLQKQGQLVNQLYIHFIAFQNKICLLETQMRSKNCFHFSTLSIHENIECGHYAEELKLLSEQFTDRFSNIFAKYNVGDVPLHLQLELIELQEDSYLKSKFDDVELS
ncbi:unnamed protein product [Psylliodes chrysocephalus]|uniref:Uncharacterized protein n=1 Tax=Psylliodes chrysocephalus TaxID=3402493 RepID=A0A9P0CJN2_9CUCU|nr:unnamed protein product [Psylliodes chrysocephala]